MNNKLRLEKRSQTRAHRSDPITWRFLPSDPPRRALLLESSGTGLAFAWRGSDCPAIDTLVHLDISPDAGSPCSTEVRVRRVTKVHDDLVVVAAEVWNAQPFPPAAAAEQVPELGLYESKPYIRGRLVGGFVSSSPLSALTNFSMGQIERAAG